MLHAPAMQIALHFFFIVMISISNLIWMHMYSNVSRVSFRLTTSYMCTFRSSLVAVHMMREFWLWIKCDFAWLNWHANSLNKLERIERYENRKNTKILIMTHMTVVVDEKVENHFISVESTSPLLCFCSVYQILFVFLFSTGKLPRISRTSIGKWETLESSSRICDGMGFKMRTVTKYKATNI